MSQKEQAETEKTEKTEKVEAPKEAEAPPKEEVKEPEKPPRKASEGIVFIGRKPVMNYVVACLTSFNAGAKEVCIKARGRSISRAVDTVELLRRAFLKGLGLKQIKIGTEEMTREEGRKSNVSTIEITVAKAES